MRRSRWPRRLEEARNVADFGVLFGYSLGEEEKGLDRAKFGLLRGKAWVTRVEER